MKQTFCGLLLAALIAMAASTAQAHHSLSAYDITKTIELDGTVKRFEWGAPHCWLIVDVPDEKGNSTEWALEAGTPVVNNRYGWKRDTFKSGDKVKVTVFPVHEGSGHGALMRVVFPDGRTLDGPLATYLKK
jgi:hypothetical protein